nr:hypothetical protein [Clostridia bacterium]
MKRKKPTLIVAMHYIRLTYRTLLFILLLVSYIVYRLGRGDSVTTFIEKQKVLLFVVWAVFVFEMVLRFFPNKYESPGCQKQFAQNYIKSGSTDIVVQDNNATLLVALIWIILNGLFGALHMLGIFDDGIMILIASAYSICDIICILFFCPFQTWFLKNKCCGTCRIYNWDYAM